MSKQRTQAEIALEHYLKNRRLGIQPKRRGESDTQNNDTRVNTDKNITSENIIRFPTDKK